MAVDAVGTGAAGATNGANGTGATVFRTGVPTTLGLQVGAIHTQIGARNRLGRVGVSNRGAPFLAHQDPSWRSMKTATDRAVEAIEAAEKIFAEEMGVTLDLSPAAKIAQIATITAAIQAAVAEERQQLTGVL